MQYLKKVECTSKGSDLRDDGDGLKREMRPKDEWYDQDAENDEKKKEEDQKTKKKQTTYIKRVIVHPSFHNISFREAEKLMVTMDQGDVIIRPSSKGDDHLTVTWKVS